MSQTRTSVAARFWAFLRKYRKLLVVAATGNFFTVCVVMFTPLIVKLIIDEAIPGKNVALLIGLVVMYLVLEVMRQTVGYGHHYIIQYVGQRVVFDIRKSLYNHLQLLHLAFYEREKAASLVNRVIHDAAAIQQFINQAVTTLASSLVSLVIASTIMFLLNWKLALLCTASLPVYFLLVHSYRKRMRAHSHEIKERQSVLAGMLGETFSGMRVVKSFAQEDHERKRFVLAIKDNFYPELALPLLSHRMFISLSLVFCLVYAAVLILGGLSVIRGIMTIGGFVAFTSYLMMLFGPVQQFSQLLQSSINARTGFERILSLLDTKPKIEEDPDPVVLQPIQGEVRFENLGFSYGKGPAITDFNLAVRPGEIIALVGPSGSGKSTLMSLLTRFYEVDSGRILIDGFDLRKLKYDVYRQQVGIVLQDNFLFSGSVEDNIRYGRPEASDAEVREAARRANASEFIERLPEKYKANVGQGGVTLSGGQRQRIAIARAILKNPRILIFDEATSALDTQSEALIQASMDELMKGKTVFIVAHRLTTIQRANRIVVMDRGKIAEIGTHDELMAMQGIYSRLYRPRVESSENEAIAI